MSNYLRSRRIAAIATAAAALAAPTVHTAGTPAKQPQAARTISPQLPLRFEPDRRSTKQGTVFAARGARYNVSVSAAGATLWLAASADTRAHRVTMSLAGARPDAAARPRHALAGVSNYLLGNDAARWVRGVRGYGEIEYRAVYPGVDVVYYGNQQQLEYDFVVAPGSSPDVIALTYDGATRVRLDERGDLVIATPHGDVVQRRPEIYQNDRGARRIVGGGYRVRRDGSIGFQVDGYDRDLPLVIDPILSYATYLGGSGFERVGGVAIDASGNVIVGGTTPSADFPVVNPPPTPPRSADVFVAKLTPAGDALIYATYFGGFGYDNPSAVVVDGAGNAYLTGYTESSDFPATTEIGVHGSSDTFVVKVDPDGTLVYSTRIGGGDQDYANAIAVDAQGRARIVGNTTSADFPVVNPLQPQLGGSAAYHSTNGGQTWSASGSGLKAAAVQGFAFDPVQPGTVFATTARDGVFRTQDSGATWSKASLPPQPFSKLATQGGAVFLGATMGVYRTTDHGDSWVELDSPLSFVTSLVATSGTSPALYAAQQYNGLVKSSNQGATWADAGLHETVQQLAAGGDTVYVATPFDVLRSSAGGPWVPSGLRLHQIVTALAVDTNNPQVAYMGTESGLLKTASGGTEWFPIAGFETAYIAAIAVAPSDPSTIFISSSLGTVVSHDAGQTWAPTGLLVDAFAIALAVDPRDSSSVYAGSTLGWDAFLAELSPDGSTLEYSTFIGGRANDIGRGVAVDADGSTYLAGETISTDFPTTNPIQPGLRGGWDAFVMKLSPQGAPVYSTYVGGSGTEFGGRLAVDAAGRAYVTGNTWSADFPLVNAAQASPGGGGRGDVFVTAINASGSAFVYSTYLGGSAAENGEGIMPSIAVTPSGEAAVTGATQSTDFPTTAAAVQRSPGGGSDDAFLSRFDAAGTLVDSTFLGRAGIDAGQAVAVDSTGVAVVAGYTNSSGWATTGVVQTAIRGGDDAFIVKIVPGDPPADTVAPTTAIALSGSSGIPGWFSSPVTVFLSATDNDQGRGVAFIEYSLNGGAFQRYAGPFVIAAAGTTQLSARATDWAGNVETPARSASVTIDATAPAIGFALSGTAGMDSWFRGPVAVSVTATDPSPGVGVILTEYRIGTGSYQRYSSPIVVSAEGVTQVTARATDANGNVATSTREVKIDTTAPQTNIGIAGTAGLEGWYRSAVTVSLGASDNGSGVPQGGIAYRINDGAFQPYTAPFVVATEGTTRITARATDRAGNVETAAPTTQFAIDVSGPIVTIASPQSRDYLHSEDMLFSFAATDGLSGVQSVSAKLDRFTAPNGLTVPLRLVPLGPYTFTVTATDAAGNIATASVSLRIIATVDSLIAFVKFYNEQGHISDSTTRSLLGKLYDAKGMLDRGNVTGAAGKVRDFIDQVSASTWRSIGTDTAEILIADGQYVLTVLSK